MKIPLPGEPEKWQAAFTADDAYHGIDTSNLYLSIISKLFSVAFWYYVFYVFIKFAFKPLLEMLVSRYEVPVAIVLLGIIVLFIIVLFSMPFIIVQNIAFRYAKEFFSELYLPSENIEPEKIIGYRLAGRMKLPMPLSDIFSSISQFKYVLVKDGEILNSSDWPAWQARNLGGPILLIVFDGCALYLERGNRFSRVVGPGAPFLEWYETIKYVVDLRPKVREGEFDVWTKDGIRIKIKARLESRVGDPKNVPIDNSLVYPYDPIAVKKAIERYALRWPNPQEEPNEFTWEDAAWGQVTGIVPGYIGRRKLDDLLVADRNGGQILSSDAIEFIFKELNGATNGFGVYVTDFQILALELPHEVTTNHVEHWKAERQSNVTMLDGQAKAYNMKAREKARAEAHHDLIVAIAEGLEKNKSKQFTESLLLALSGVVDDGLKNPLIRAQLAIERLDILEKLKAILEKE